MSIGVGVRTLKPRRPGPRTALALAAVLLAMAPAEAEAQADLLPRDPNVTTGRLDNGFSYYIRHNERPQDRAELRLVVNVGSLLEDPDQLGLAHFAEHMAFNGTARFPRQAIVDYLERIGVRFGADLNAATSFDYTIYMLTVPTDRAGVLETAFDIMEDWAMAVTFDSLEIERERGVVMEEWRAGRGAGARIADRQFPILLQGSRYAARLPIGSPASLQAFEHHALRRFYRDWYRPDLMALVAVGDFDPSQVESLITSRFSGMTPPAADARERIAYDVPPHQEPRYAPATDPEEIGSTIAVYFKGPARDASTVGSYRRSIVEQLFSSMINDRLFEIQQQPDAPFLYASVAQGRFVRPLDMWLLVAGVPDSGGAPVRGLESILTEAARVVRFGFTASELDRHKRLFEREMERVFDERDKTNSSQYAGEYVRHFLDGEPYPGIATEFRLHRELLPGIALDEVDAVAQQLFQDSNRVVLFSGPGTVEPPAEPVLMQLFESVGERELVAYEDRAGDLAIVPDPPKPGTVVAERRVASLDVTEWRLSNGVRVLLKATDFRDDEVVFRAMSPGGTSLVEDEDYVPASTATAVVTAGGVGELDLVALQKTLAGKIVSVFPEIYGIAEGMSGRASAKDLSTLFELIHAYFTAPRRDSSAFVNYQQRSREFLRNRDVSPEVAFADTVNAVLSQNHFRTRPYTVELFDELDLDRSLDFYRDRFADASDFTFAFVGAFSLDSIRPLVETYLGGLPRLDREDRWIDRGIYPPTGVVEKVVRRGVEPQAQTQFVFTGPFEYTRESAHMLQSMASILDLRLRESLREDLGATYGASVGASASRLPTPSFRVGVHFGSAPDRVDEMVTTMFREIARLKQDGPLPGDLDKIKEIQRRTRETSLRENGFWLNGLITQARYDLPLDELLDFDEILNAMTADDIRDAARAWLPKDNYVRVTLLPEGR